MADNIILTNRHIAGVANDSDPAGCGKLKVKLNSPNDTSVFNCKKLLFCHPTADFCFVEMKPNSEGKKISDFANRLTLATEPVKTQASALLIGNHYSFGIEAAGGPIEAENFETGNFKHWIPTAGACSGSPVFGDNKVIGINSAHVVKVKDKRQDTVLGNSETDYNEAISSKFIFDSLQSNASVKGTHQILCEVFQKGCSSK